MSLSPLERIRVTPVVIAAILGALECHSAPDEIRKGILWGLDGAGRVACIRAGAPFSRECIALDEAEVCRAADGSLSVHLEGEVVSEKGERTPDADFVIPAAWMPAAPRRLAA